MSNKRRHLWETIAGICILLSLVIGTSAWIRVDHIARDALTNSRITCERTIKCAPYLGRALGRLEVFPPKILKEYIAEVPKECQ